MAESRNSESVEPFKYVLEAQTDFSSLSSLNLVSEPVDPTVCKEHGQEFEYFCKSHMVELCLACRRIQHKNCKTVVDMEEAAREKYTTSHTDKITQSLKQLSERFGFCEATARKSKAKLPNKRQSVIDSVKQTRKSMDAYLDRLEANAIAEINKVFDRQTKTLDEQINICNASISFLNASLFSVNRIKSFGNNEETFVEINRATKQIKQYCSTLHDLSQDLCVVDIKFEENVKVSKLDILLENLGKCSVVLSSVSHGTMETAPIYSGEILFTTNRRLGDRDDAGNDSKQRDAAHAGSETTVITSFDILPDGRQLLIDEPNKKLKLYDHNNFLVTEHVPSVKPVHVVVLSNTEAVVSTLTNILLKVTIGEGLAVSRTKSKYDIRAINRCGVDIIAILVINNIAQVSVLDKDFTIKKTIIKDDKHTLFRNPTFLATSEDRTMLFVVDFDNGCFGFTMDDQVRFHYQDQEGKSYFGLAVGRDCLFLGVPDEKKKYHVNKLNFSGERVACPDFGVSAPLRVVDNELVLFTGDGKGNRMINFYFLFH